MSDKYWSYMPPVWPWPSAPVGACGCPSPVGTGAVTGHLSWSWSPPEVEGKTPGPRMTRKWLLLGERRRRLAPVAGLPGRRREQRLHVRFGLLPVTEAGLLLTQAVDDDELAALRHDPVRRVRATAGHYIGRWIGRVRPPPPRPPPSDSRSRASST